MPYCSDFVSTTQFQKSVITEFIFLPSLTPILMACCAHWVHAMCLLSLDNQQDFMVSLFSTQSYVIGSAVILFVLQRAALTVARVNILLRSDSLWYRAGRERPLVNCYRPHGNRYKGLMAAAINVMATAMAAAIDLMAADIDPMAAAIDPMAAAIDLMAAADIVASFLHPEQWGNVLAQLCWSIPKRTRYQSIPLAL